MTRRLIAVEVDGTIMTLKGWQAHGLGLGAGIKTVYNGVQQGWVADSKRLADLLAYCQMRNIAVDVRGGTDVPSVGNPTPDTDVSPGECQLDLFGGEVA